MHFFDMGMGEILLVILIALLIWGPGKIPEIARTLGKTVRALKKVSSDLTTQITKELDMEEKDSLSQPRSHSDDKAKKSSDVDTAEPRDGDVTGQND